MTMMMTVPGVTTDCVSTRISGTVSTVKPQKKRKIAENLAHIPCLGKEGKEGREKREKEEKRRENSEPSRVAGQRLRNTPQSSQPRESSPSLSQSLPVQVPVPLPASNLRGRRLQAHANAIAWKTRFIAWSPTTIQD